MPLFIDPPKYRPVTITLPARMSERLRNRAIFVGHEPQSLIRALIQCYLDQPEIFERHRDSRGDPVFHVQPQLAYTGPDLEGIPDC